jgi:hypothetical protein
MLTAKPAFATVINKGIIIMKYTILLMALLSTAAFADSYVSGHTRSDGTYVQGHYRSSPDSSKQNNYSERGNSNPYTGKEGTRDSINSQNNSGTYSNPYDTGSRRSSR